MTVVKELEKGIFDMALVDFEMSSGTNHWEITIDKMEFTENLLIGVARKGLTTNINPFDTGLFWGIQPLT